MCNHSIFTSFLLSILMCNFFLLGIKNFFFHFSVDGMAVNSLPNSYLGIQFWKHGFPFIFFHRGLTKWQIAFIPAMFSLIFSAFVAILFLFLNESPWWQNLGTIATNKNILQKKRHYIFKQSHRMKQDQLCILRIRY